MKSFFKSKITLFILLILCSTPFIGCDEVNTTATNVDKKIQKATAESQAEAIRQIGGMPAIKNYTELKLAKWILELRDNPKLVCYVYTYNTMTGKFHFQGKCIGYGLPYSVQITNPNKLVDADDYLYCGSINDIFVLPQADPNMLYPPSGLSATFVVMIDDKGKPSPVYMEPNVTISPFPLRYAIYPEGVDFFK